MTKEPFQTVSCRKLSSIMQKFEKQMIKDNRVHETFMVFKQFKKYKDGYRGWDDGNHLLVIDMSDIMILTGPMRCFRRFCGKYVKKSWAIVQKSGHKLISPLGMNALKVHYILKHKKWICTSEEGKKEVKELENIMEMISSGKKFKVQVQS